MEDPLPLHIDVRSLISELFRRANEAMFSDFVDAKGQTHQICAPQDIEERCHCGARMIRSVCKYCDRLPG